MNESDYSVEIALLAGALSVCTDDERVLLEKLCALSEQEVARRLRAGVTAKDCAGAYVCAAAWLAAAALESARGGESYASLRAGDMSVRTASAGERAARVRELREQAARMLAPYAVSESFCFLGVDG